MASKKPLAYALASWFCLCLISYWGALYMNWGPAESAHDPSSVWMYARRLLLTACALLLPAVAGGKGPGSYGWSISVKWLLISIPIGVAQGFGNPGGFDPRHVSAIVLAGMHAGMTELFFRAYLITTLLQYFKSIWPPILVSSVMYGLFYLTVWKTWNPANPLFFIGLFTFIGLLHGYCYVKSKSFIAPWLIHFLGVLKYKLLF